MKINMVFKIITFLFCGTLLIPAGLSDQIFAQSMVNLKEDSLITDKSTNRFYTAYNIWYEAGKENSLWCINYKTGVMIPAGAEVKNVRIVPSVTGRKQGGGMTAIYFVTENDGQKYWVNFNQNFHPGKTIQDYKDMMFTTKTFAELTGGMSETEIQGIKKGIVKIGMSKEAVLIAFGYPPEHKTPSLEESVWLYWMNRFRTKAINFDSDNRAMAIPKDPDEL